MINNKEIINKDKKYCRICGKAYENDGIIFNKSSICKSCVDEITLIDCNDLKYEYMKDKIKSILF